MIVKIDKTGRKKLAENTKTKRDKREYQNQKMENREKATRKE